ncbi:MAG: T9SS type A sorting domain-containing protein [Bacteroidales bacterium]
MQYFQNPFSTSTTIEYVLPDPATVVLRIFGSFGQLLDEPINGYREKGKQRIEWAAKGLAPGIYYCRLQAGNKVVMNKIVRMH